MPILFLNEQALPRFIRRIESLQPDSPRLWGSMTAPQMLAHLRRAFELWLGDIRVPEQGNFLTRTVLRWIVFHSGLPWPKGKIKAPPVFFPDKIDDFETERSRTLHIMKRFVDTVKRQPDRIHINPVFGRLPFSYLPRMAGMHTDHHLRQFGV